MKNTASVNGFMQQFEIIQSYADDLPASVIIHKVDGLQIIYMNRIGLKGLGTTLEELLKTNSAQYHSKHFNSKSSSDYISKVMQLIEKNTSEKVSYFQEVRSPATKEWQLYISNTKIFARNDAGKPTHIITIASLLDPEHHVSSKVARLLDEASFFRENTRLYLSLTKREREILKCMALGMNSGEIGEKLFIASATADTHRKNIRKKLNLKTNYDAVKFAQAYNLV